MAFYDEMRGMVAELLAADSAGGLGQVGAVLVRTTPGPVDPEADWEEAAAVVVSEPLRASVSGAAALADGTTILASDFRVMAAVPDMDYRFPEAGGHARLSLTLDGRPFTIIRVRAVPPVGTPVAVEFVVRG